MPPHRLLKVSMVLDTHAFRDYILLNHKSMLDACRRVYKFSGDPTDIINYTTFTIHHLSYQQDGITKPLLLFFSSPTGTSLVDGRKFL